jgi:hypothetical protein
MAKHALLQFVPREGASPAKCKRHGLDIEVSVKSGTKIRACACFRLTFPTSAEGTAAVELMEKDDLDA